MATCKLYHGAENEKINQRSTMRSVAMEIEGSYYDSFVYKGRLYLFSMDGTVRTYDWTKMLAMLPAQEEFTLSLQAAFLEADYLTRGDVRGLARDAEIRRVIVDKFERLASAKITFTKTHLEAALIDEMHSPFPFPHAALELYADYAYCASSQGVYRASVKRGLVHAFSSRVNRIFEKPALHVSGYWGRIAISCGPEGLWAARAHWARGFAQISEADSRAHDWMRSSILSTTYGSAVIAVDVGGMHAALGGAMSMLDQTNGRQFDKILVSAESARESSIACGYGDRAFLVNSDAVTVYAFDGFELLCDRKIMLPPAVSSFGRVVSAFGTSFGAVAEFEQGMLVIGDDDSLEILAGEPVNWRVESRNVRYFNQLHLVYNDHIQIRSYNPQFLTGQRRSIEQTRRLDLAA